VLGRGETPMMADRVRGAMSVPMTPAAYSAEPRAGDYFPEAHKTR
jgi:hypothetical protein